MNETAQTLVLQRVVDHVRRCLPSVYRNTPLTLETPFESLPIDSLSWFVLVRALEKEFELRLWLQVESRDGLHTIGDLVALLTRGKAQS